MLKQNTNIRHCYPQHYFGLISFVSLRLYLRDQAVCRGCLLFGEAQAIAQRKPLLWERLTVPLVKTELIT